MENVHAKPSLLHRVVSLAILGFLIVVMAGPLMTVLSFAVIGFAGWVIYRALSLGKKVAWDDVREASKVVWQNIVWLAGWLCGWANEGADAVRTHFWPTAKESALRVRNRVRSSAGLVFHIAIEAVSAGIIGALLGGVLSNPDRFSEESIILGGSIGALVGAVYGARLARPAKEPVTEQANSNSERGV